MTLNSIMVRFILLRKDFRALENALLSIPLWFDSYLRRNKEIKWRPSSLNSIMVRFIQFFCLYIYFFIIVSQFHYGSIHTSSKLYFFLLSNLNSIMVRFILQMTKGQLSLLFWISIPLWFDSYSQFS